MGCHACRPSSAGWPSARLTEVRLLLRSGTPQIELAPRVAERGPNRWRAYPMPSASSFARGAGGNLGWSWVWLATNCQPRTFPAALRDLGFRSDHVLPADAPEAPGPDQLADETESAPLRSIPQDSRAVVAAAGDSVHDGHDPDGDTAGRADNLKDCSCHNTIRLLAQHRARRPIPPTGEAVMRNSGGRVDDLGGDGVSNALAVEKHAAGFDEVHGFEGGLGLSAGSAASPTYGPACPAEISRHPAPLEVQASTVQQPWPIDPVAG